MIGGETFTERVKTVRLLEQQRQVINKMPSWDCMRDCSSCGTVTNHLDVAFEEQDPEGPYLTACEVCLLVTFPDISVQARVRQIRAWAKWGRETGHTVPVWLFLLPGEPAEAAQ